MDPKSVRPDSHIFSNENDAIAVVLLPRDAVREPITEETVHETALKIFDKIVGERRGQQ